MLLQTKLTVPPLRPNLVPRPQLIERLNQGLELGNKLTLVSAPAGFGKSTVVAQWLHLSKVAWLSLGSEENNVARFLAYFIAAIQSVDVSLGIDSDSIFKSPQLPPLDTILTSIINNIAGAQSQFILVLDDFHLIETLSIHQALAFLLDHLPAQMHLVIITRADPNLPLARLRGRAQINEIRDADLRFTVRETAAFLHQVVGKEIAEEQIDALTTRTEGWAAALQMAAVSLRTVEDVPGFIATFAGDHRYIVDYLMDEVLDQCRPETRDFLLRTAILERMSAPLCNALTGRSDGQKTLEKLDHDNLFTRTLDQRREWYRYHHLFVDLLRRRLKQIYPEDVEELHYRASRWLDDNGFTGQAIGHALASEDKHLAADLLVRHARTLLYQGEAQIQNLLDWFRQLPEDLVRERPLLNIFYAWTLVFTDPLSHIIEVKRLLAQAQEVIEQANSDGTTNRVVAGHIASIQGLLSQPPVQTDHDPHTVLALLEEAQSVLPADEVEVRSDNYINIGYEYMHLEDSEAALEANRAAFTEAQAGENHLVAMVARRNQALVAYYLGNLDQALEICQTTIAQHEHLRSENGQPLPGLGPLFIMLGYLLLEQGQLAEAKKALTEGMDLLPWFGEYESLSLGHIAQTRLLLLQGDHSSALQVGETCQRQWPACLALAETLRIQVELSPIERDPSCLPGILAWLQENEIDFESVSNFQGISPWVETQHLTHLTWIQAQLALTQLKVDPANEAILLSCLAYLDQRIERSQQNKIQFRVIECSILKALVLEGLAKSEQALGTLAQAVSLAMPQGFRRVFLDKGRPMRRLLKKVPENEATSPFVLQLLAAFERPLATKAAPPTQDLVEPLSERELEVLQLVAKGLSNREIGERLFLALDTVKGHNRRIYAKLGVKNRTQAVSMATSLKVISPIE